MNNGMQVTYKGEKFWIVSVLGETVELSRTSYGHGSFYTTVQYIEV